MLTLVADPDPAIRLAEEHVLDSLRAALLHGSREALARLLRADRDIDAEDPLIGDTAVYEGPGPDDTARRLKQCEKWLQSYPDDHWLHLALGRLCAREELWGKARQHMIRSLELESTVLGYDTLGQLLERKGELEASMVCYRNALRLSQGKEPLPLPGDHVQLEAPLTSTEGA